MLLGTRLIVDFDVLMDLFLADLAIRPPHPTFRRSVYPECV